MSGKWMRPLAPPSKGSGPYDKSTSRCSGACCNLIFERSFDIISVLAAEAQMEE